jgi:hypothetical protein
VEVEVEVGFWRWWRRGEALMLVAAQRAVRRRVVVYIML